MRAKRLLFPIVERDFTYAAYDAFLGRLAADPRVRVVPLRELREAEAEAGVVVGLRHDVDLRLDSAVRMAELERARGFRATYYALHTAPYWTTAALVPSLLRIQDELGHEVGWHNDLVTIEVVDGVDARAYLAGELERLRGAGLRIDGVASHGSGWCHRLGYHNTYFWDDFPAVLPGFPNRHEVDGKPIPHGRLAEFGFVYEAYDLGEDTYASDTYDDRAGTRWHPRELDLVALPPGSKAIVHTHPCHWDASVPAKVGRLAGRVADRVTRVLP